MWWPRGKLLKPGEAGSRKKRQNSPPSLSWTEMPRGDDQRYHHHGTARPVGWPWNRSSRPDTSLGTGLSPGGSIVNAAYLMLTTAWLAGQTRPRRHSPASGRPSGAPPQWGAVVAVVRCGCATDTCCER